MSRRTLPKNASIAASSPAVTIGDRYGGEWPAERFREHSIHYRIADKTKSEIYQTALPMLNSTKVELLDNKTLRQQLVGLERRTSRGGRDSIDHRPGGRDDVANSVAGALIRCVHSEPMGADLFAQGGVRAAGFAHAARYYEESFIDWTRAREGGLTLWDQRPREEKK
jgi:hypothetical protein